MKELAKRAGSVLFFVTCCLGFPLLVWRLNSSVPTAVLPATGWSEAQSPFISTATGISGDDWQRFQALAARKEREAQKWKTVFPYKIPRWFCEIITIYGLYAFFGLMGWLTCVEVWDRVKDLPDES